MPKQRSEEEQKMMCNAWKKSGLSQRDFCQQNRISSKSLWRWLKDLRENVGDNRDRTSSLRRNSSGNITSSNKNIKFFPIDPNINANAGPRVKRYQINKQKKNHESKSILEISLLQSYQLLLLIIIAENIQNITNHDTRYLWLFTHFLG